MKNRFTFKCRNGVWGEKNARGWVSHFYRRISTVKYGDFDWALPYSVTNKIHSGHNLIHNLRHEEWLRLGDPYRTTLGKIVFALELNEK